jgi:hypothetical protein
MRALSVEKYGTSSGQIRLVATLRMSGVYLLFHVRVVGVFWVKIQCSFQMLAITSKSARCLWRNVCVGVGGSWRTETMPSHLTRDLPTDKPSPKQRFLLNLDGAFPFPHSCAIVTLQTYQWRHYTAQLRSNQNVMFLEQVRFDNQILVT